MTGSKYGDSGVASSGVASSGVASGVVGARVSGIARVPRCHSGATFPRERVDMASPRTSPLRISHVNCPAPAALNALAAPNADVDGAPLPSCGPLGRPVHPRITQLKADAASCLDDSKRADAPITALSARMARV